MKLAVPRLTEPSCNFNVAKILPPQTPLALKVKDWFTGAPPAAKAPYVCGPLGEDTPPLARRVATRLPVADAPTFCRAKFIVTVSFGLTAPFPGEQSWLVTVEPPLTTTGTATCAPL